MPNLYAPQSLNRYGYVVNNPIRYSDPTGHMCSNPEDPSPTCEGREFPNSTVYNNPVISGSINIIIPPEALDDGLIPGQKTEQRAPIPIDPTQQQFVDDPPPPVSTARLIVGTIAGLVFLVPGILLIAAGLAALPAEPAGAFALSAGGVLVVLSFEVIYQTWRPLLPPSWPKFLIINYPI